MALVATVVCWGVAPAFIRSFSVTFGPSDAMFIRLVSVALMCVPFLPFYGASMDWRDVPRLLLVAWGGIFSYFVGSIFGFTYITSGLGSLINATQPFIIAALAAALGREKLHPATLLGMAVAFAGAVYLFSGDIGTPGTTDHFLRGAILIFASGIPFAINVVCSKPLVEKYGTMRTTLLTMIAAGVPALAFFHPGIPAIVMSLDLYAWWCLFYLGFIGTILASVTWYFAINRLPPTTIGASVYVIPLLAVASGWLILGEKVTIHTLFAGLVILTGVAISEFGKNLSLPNQLKGLAAVIFAVTMWGMVPVAMRFLLTDLKPQTAILLRLYPAAVTALVIAAWLGWRDLSRNDWARILAASLIGNLGYQLLAGFGIKLIPAAWTGMLFGLEPVFIALGAILFAGERLSAFFVIGLMAALAGTGVLILGSATGTVKDVSLLGVILVMLCTLGWAIYTTLIRPVSLRHGAVPVACLSIGITGLPTLALMDGEVVQEVFALTPLQWLVVLFVSVFATVFAISAWNYSLGKMSSAAAGMFLYVQPIVAAAGGILLLGESPSIWLFAGGVLIFAGVAISQMKGRAARQPHHGAPSPKQVRLPA